ncbi:MAG: divalent-cation tolerance protein CutA [Hydrogenobacter thermophilus]|uniref:divalent-cation tolerance protein CutA n=1 Tax=Hydrogenobacter thermophilus TaxID=940 RepID=UPI001C794388|nr:divalent-cation tolerance protein CutA [Hydrogenobacter thermophilus]QWK19481.1 MAG: divalent-cation tolerance protein CutA [Hydrogenobacter thermophilus]
MHRYFVVFITAPVDRAEDVAQHIIKEKLGACVNIVREVNSIYWWKGNIERGKESLLMVKTAKEKLRDLVDGVKSIHPYTVPEIIAIPIETGNEDYLKWIDESLGISQESS